MQHNELTLPIGSLLRLIIREIAIDDGCAIDMVSLTLQSVQGATIPLLQLASGRCPMEVAVV